MSDSEKEIQKKVHNQTIETSQLPIAVFDSGVGGISVLREMVKIMPSENFLYYGDSKNAPYGTKSLDEVRRLTIEHTKDFLERPVKAVAIACNTATSAAVRILRQMYPKLPLVGIEPALKPAVLHKPNAKILVMATPMTIREEKFKKLLSLYEGQAEIFSLPCPGLMEFVEEGKAESEETYKFLSDLLQDYRGGIIDAVVLGCTHYPFVKAVIQDVLGDEVIIFDGGEGTAREMKRRLSVAGLLNAKTQKGNIIFENSDSSEEKIDLCKKLFNS